jgi:arylsulfatase A-like enzyme
MSGRISLFANAREETANGVVAPATVQTAAPRSPSRFPLSFTASVLLAIAFGLCGGYLDLLLMLCRNLWWNDEWIIRFGRDFAWTVPASLAVWLLILALVIGAVCRLRPGLISLRAGSWLFATVAIWAALLRLPLYGAGTLLLAIGLGRPISATVAARRWSPRIVACGLTGLLALLIVLGALSSGRQLIEERRALAGLPPAPPGARNVVLIVWDTVRAYNLSAYGYARNTTPNLARWARQGVLYNRALAPATWTYPSHSCFFTGQWPFQLDSQWKFQLDTPDPTLAEYLASRGYQTAGFSANNICCNYETGLARGFAHFEDFPLTPRFFLCRTVPGRWILKNVLSRGNYHSMKWIDLQSRGAWETSQAFLAWLRQRRPDRPFFAFVNFFDAHSPYVPPPGYDGRFGIRPKPPRDYEFLLGVMNFSAKRDAQMALDCYDDCIAFLDDQLGRLLHALRGQGLLDNSVVIITSDHGEAFGDHGGFGHYFTVYLDVTGVPLLILSPEAPAGRVVDTPVSLRDLPATVLDQVGLSAGSPFRGRSLAAHWRSEPGPAPQAITTPALSEQAAVAAFHSQSGGATTHGAVQMSLVASGHQYVRDDLGAEKLYDLIRDPFERDNLIGTPYGDKSVGPYRKMLLDMLTENPGSSEAEKSYLGHYRQALKAVVHESSAPRVAASH